MRRIEGDFPLVPPADVARARIVDVPWLTPGVAAMTLGRVILLRRDHAGDEALLAHELVHVRQWRELGVARFLWRYLGAYARGGPPASATSEPTKRSRWKWKPASLAGR